MTPETKVALIEASLAIEAAWDKRYAAAGDVPGYCEGYLDGLEHAARVVQALTDGAQVNTIDMHNNGSADDWTNDPYDEPIFIQGHSHSEPVCAWPDCETYLTRRQMATLHRGGAK